MKPLVQQIRNGTDRELIIGINGDYKVNFDENYRADILYFCHMYDNTYPFIYPAFRSLAKIWNEIVINSTSDYILILNDDTEIPDPEFFNAVQGYIDLLQTSFVINNIFGHFVIKKQELIKCGWFDERFLGIGWEDLEFMVRYEKVFKRKIFVQNGVVGIKTFFDDADCVENQKKGNKKYTKFNEIIYERRLKHVSQYPHEPFYLTHIDEL